MPVRALKLFLRQGALHRGPTFPASIPNNDALAARNELKRGCGKKLKTTSNFDSELGLIAVEKIRLSRRFDGVGHDAFAPEK